MKEKLIKYLRDNEKLTWEVSSRDFQRMITIIESFFNAYQPERSKREDPHLTLDDIPNDITTIELKYKMEHLENQILGCGALNSVEI